MVGRLCPPVRAWWPGLLAGLTLSVLLPALAGAQVPGKQSHRAPLVRDVALAKVLGETLFRDTAEVIAQSPLQFQVADLGGSTAPVPGSGPKSDLNAQVARALLLHRPIDKYLWLIQRAFDESLWKGSDGERLQRNFPLIWRAAITLYESTLGAEQARVRICAPTDTIDEFACMDKREPARIVPIPAEAPSLLDPEQANNG